MNQSKFDRIKPSHLKKPIDEILFIFVFNSKCEFTFKSTDIEDRFDSGISRFVVCVESKFQNLRNYPIY